MIVNIRLAAAICSLTAWAISTMALVGHLLSWTQFYRWRPDDVGMALNTSIALNLLSIAVFLVVNWNHLWSRNGRSAHA